MLFRFNSTLGLVSQDKSQFLSDKVFKIEVPQVGQPTVMPTGNKQTVMNKDVTMCKTKIKVPTVQNVIKL